MFTTTIAGSLPKPAWLSEPEQLFASWKLEGDALIEGQRRAAREWIEHQQAAGIDIVTEGEQGRIHFVHGFLQHIDGIDWELKTEMGIRDNRYTVEVPTVTGAISRTGSVHGDEARYARSVATNQLKFTLPVPMTICDTIADAHYGKRADMAMAFADALNEEAKELEAAGVDVVQFDEPAFNVFTQDVLDWGIEALHRAMDGLNCTTAVHICYGYGIEANRQWKDSLGSEWRQYEAIFPALNASRVDQISLECAHSRVPMSLLGLLPDKQLMVGAVGVEADAVETPEEVAATLKAAMQYVDKERIMPCSNCGMAPIGYDIALAKLRALGEGARLAA